MFPGLPKDTSSGPEDRDPGGAFVWPDDLLARARSAAAGAGQGPGEDWGPHKRGDTSEGDGAWAPLSWCWSHTQPSQLQPALGREGRGPGENLHLGPAAVQGADTTGRNQI